MKNALIFFGIVIALALLVLVIVRSGSSPEVASYAADDPEAPKIEIAEKNYDFGKINPDDIARHEFKITNTGKNPLVITDIMTSCHCTKAVLKISGESDSPEFGMHADPSWQGEIAPGIEANLEVAYEPAVMPVKGRVSRVVTFRTNDPANKEVQLEFTGEVQ